MSKSSAETAKTEQNSGGRHPHRTRNALPSNAKAASISLLNARLADGIDLALATKQAHWNLKGPQFIGIHLMLDGFRTDQDEWNDEMAERAVQLGGTALGTTQAVNAATKLPPYPTDTYAVADHLAALIDRFAEYGNALRTSIDECAALVPGSPCAGTDRPDARRRRQVIVARGRAVVRVRPQAVLKRIVSKINNF
jgi:starvation-inducible DNA-binding protein